MEIKKTTIDIEMERREFIQEIIDRYLYLNKQERAEYVEAINRLNDVYKISTRKLQLN